VGVGVGAHEGGLPRTGGAESVTGALLWQRAAATFTDVMQVKPTNLRPLLAGVFLTMMR
jgi:hypothetical protein